MNIEIAFRSVYGRDPNAEEINRFNRLAKELGIRDNDALWAVVFLLGHHLELTKQMPERMEQLTSQSLESYRSALLHASKSAESELLATKARIEEAVSKTVVISAQNEIARAAQTVARDSARKSWLRWLGGAVVLGMLLISGAFYWGFDLGNDDGYIRALDVKEISSWAATSVGQDAYRLDHNGDLIRIIRCENVGWRIKKTQAGKNGCFVYPDHDGNIHGWLLP